MDLNHRAPQLHDEELAEVLTNVQAPRALGDSADVRRGSEFHGSDATPPPDHEGFLEARALGLRAIRKSKRQRLPPLGRRAPVG
jgi:hypothetical protein